MLILHWLYVCLCVSSVCLGSAPGDPTKCPWAAKAKKEPEPLLVYSWEPLVLRPGYLYIFDPGDPGLHVYTLDIENVDIS